MAARRSVRAIVAAVVGMLLLIATSGPASSGAAPAPQDDGVGSLIARYRSTIPELMDEEQVPGLAVAVVDGDGVWQQGFGSTERDGGSPVTVDTIFSVDVEGLLGHGRVAGGADRSPGH